MQNQIHFFNQFQYADLETLRKNFTSTRQLRRKL